MTDRELMQQALEALEIESKGYNDKVVRNRGIITALRERLAQPEQEPVCDKDPQGCWNVRCQLGKVCKNTSPRREWVGLTEEEKLIANQMWRVMDADGFIEAIEAKLKERNT